MKKNFIYLLNCVSLLLLIFMGCNSSNNNPNNKTCGDGVNNVLEVHVTKPQIDCGDNSDVFLNPKPANHGGVELIYSIVRRSDNKKIVDYDNDHPTYSDCGGNVWVYTISCNIDFKTDDEYIITAKYYNVTPVVIGGTYVDIGNPNIIRKDIEYDAMSNSTANICGVQNQIVDCDLTDYYWDNDMKSAYYTDCGVSLNFNNYKTDLTYEIINTYDGTDNKVRQAFDDYYSNHRNNTWNYPYFVGSVSRYSVFSTYPTAVGYSHRYDPTPPPGLNENDHHNWSFVFNQRVIELDCSQQYNWKFTENAVLAHELGHAFGIPLSGHDNHSGNNSDCCVMHVGHPPCGNIVFCDGHINIIKNSQP